LRETFHFKVAALQPQWQLPLSLSSETPAERLTEICSSKESMMAFYRKHLNLVEVFGYRRPGSAASFELGFFLFVPGNTWLNLFGNLLTLGKHLV